MFVLCFIFLLCPAMAIDAGAAYLTYKDTIDSVELLAARCDTIMYARLSESSRIAIPHTGYTGKPLEFEVLQVLKGNSDSPVRVEFGQVQWPIRHLEPGDDVVLARLPALGDRNYWIILGIEPGARDVWGLNLKPLTSVSSVLAAFRDAIEYPSPRSPATHSLYIAPFTSDVERGPRNLVFPVDGRLETAARRWAYADNPGIRQYAVLALTHFRSEQNIALLRSMLQDPYAASYKNPQGFSINIYTVRRQAMHQLIQWDQHVPQDLVLETPSALHQFVYYFRWELLVLASILVLTPILHVLVRWCRRRRFLHVEPFTRRRLAFNAIALFSFLLAVSVL